MSEPERQASGAQASGSLSHADASSGSGEDARGPAEATTKTAWVRWTREEHDLLASLVAKYGLNRSWSVIASHIPGRTGKQCRERWLNHTGNDGTKKGNWASSEEYIMACEHAANGSHWSQISRNLPGRTDNSVKNHWNATWRSKVMHKPQSILWLYTQELKANHAPHEALKKALIRWEKNVSAQHVLDTLGFWPSDKYAPGNTDQPAMNNQASVQNTMAKGLLPLANAAAQFLGQRSSNDSDTSLEQFPAAAAVAVAPLGMQQTPPEGRNSGTTTTDFATLGIANAAGALALAPNLANQCLTINPNLFQLPNAQPQLMISGGGFVTQSAPTQLMLNGQPVQVVGMPQMVGTPAAQGLMQAGQAMQLQMLNGMQLLPATQGTTPLTAALGPYAAPIANPGPGGAACFLIPPAAAGAQALAAQPMPCAGGAMMLPMGLAAQPSAVPCPTGNQTHVMMTVAQLQELLAGRVPGAGQDTGAPPLPQVVPSLPAQQQPEDAKPAAATSASEGTSVPAAAATTTATTAQGPTVHAMTAGQVVALNPQQQAALLTQLLSQQGITAVMV